jgi:hypothetical protein
VRDDHTVVDYSIPHFVGSGFGFSLYSYIIGDATQNPVTVMKERLLEYATWGDPASAIIADPAQAERVNRAIRFRMSGKPGWLAAAEPATPRGPTASLPP